MDEEKILMQMKIQELKKRRNAIILAHNYQIEEVQGVADIIGDSFELSRAAAQSQADVIVFCGVHFMAEGAAILAPDKITLLPDMEAGCPMADMVTARTLREKKKEHPSVAVVTYINSPAAVKAESDICVTSSNAVEVVKSLPDRKLLFVPDMNLGDFVARHTDKRVIPWEGYCPTHHHVSAADVATARAENPDAVVVVHPECRPEVVEAADYAFSTGGILKFARETGFQKIIVGTEKGLIYRLQKENPGKEFYLLSEKLICPTMKLINLQKILRSLETLEPRVTVPEDIRDRARLALERMLVVV
ncbi:MAG: quinolinate synthase NadA [Dethiobacteria bacterium]|jgi:quinolinate synthase